MVAVEAVQPAVAALETGVELALGLEPGGVRRDQGLRATTRGALLDQIHLA